MRNVSFLSRHVWHVTFWRSFDRLMRGRAACQDKAPCLAEHAETTLILICLQPQVNLKGRSSLQSHIIVMPSVPSITNDTICWFQKGLGSEPVHLSRWLLWFPSASNCQIAALVCLLFLRRSQHPPQLRSHSPWHQFCSILLLEDGRSRSEMAQSKTPGQWLKDLNSPSFC